MHFVHSLTIDTRKRSSPLAAPAAATPEQLPEARHHHTHSAFPLAHSDEQDATKLSIYFVGTATTIFEHKYFRIMTDPNFLHAGDHVHLGPGVNAQRVTNPAVSLDELPSIDLVLLSHFHEDHFDKEVQERLRKDLPILTTTDAVEPLRSLGFEAVRGLQTWESAKVNFTADDSSPLSLSISSTPGKHVAGVIVESLNAFASAVPPTMGTMLDFVWEDRENEQPAFRVYISGDTLFVKDLESIPVRYPNIDLLMIHLGGTTIPGPHLPLLMVTMDAKQGIQLVQLIKPKLTLPIHYDDYDVFLSPLSDFKKGMQDADLAEQVVYLDRGERFSFSIRS